MLRELEFGSDLRSRIPRKPYYLVCDPKSMQTNGPKLLNTAQKAIILHTFEVHITATQIRQDVAQKQQFVRDALTAPSSSGTSEEAAMLLGDLSCPLCMGMNMYIHIYIYIYGRPPPQDPP